MIEFLPGNRLRNTLGPLPRKQYARGEDKLEERKPIITGTAHTLPFDKLSPREFERLCLWLVEAEGYARAEHLGAAGSEQGRDITAWQGGKQWAFQCKRVQAFHAKQVLVEVDKVLALPAGRRPVGLVFLVTCDVAANARQRARDRCQAAGLACDFWTGAELDLRVKRHPEIVDEFFAVGAGSRPAIQADHGSAVAGPRGIAQVGNGNVGFTGDVQGGVNIVLGGGGPAARGSGAPGAAPPDLAPIRDLLLDAFTAADLRRLVFYAQSEGLRRLGQEFAESDGLAAMVAKTLRFCHARVLLPDLLREVERENPRQYQRYAHRLHPWR